MRRRVALALLALPTLVLARASAQERSVPDPFEPSQQITAAERDLMVTRDRLGDRRAVLHQRLRSIYKRGPLHSVEVLLTAESFGELLNRYKYLVLIARHDRQLVREVAVLEAQLASRERLLQRTLDPLVDEGGELPLAEGDLAASRGAAAAQRSARLAAGERTLRALLTGLERSGSLGTGTLTNRDAGTLAWPVPGELLYSFGRQMQPDGAVVRWNGIGIGAAAGAQARAVEEGRVVMAGPLEGYGPTVVVSHGGGYHSLYLYLQRVAVREGETIARNQVVGTVGGTGTPEGPHLEFQIRAPGAVAVDPLEWLRAGGSE